MQEYMCVHSKVILRNFTGERSYGLLPDNFNTKMSQVGLHYVFVPAPFVACVSFY